MNKILKSTKKYLRIWSKYLVKSLKKHSIKNWFFALFGIGIVLFGILAIWISTLQLPDFKSFTDRKIQSSTKIYDRTGTILLYDVHQDIKRTIIPYESMGINIKNATVAIEDSEFYNHKGIRIKFNYKSYSLGKNNREKNPRWVYYYPAVNKEYFINVRSYFGAKN